MRRHYECPLNRRKKKIVNRAIGSHPASSQGADTYGVVSLVRLDPGVMPYFLPEKGRAADTPFAQIIIVLQRETVSLNYAVLELIDLRRFRN